MNAVDPLDERVAIFHLACWENGGELVRAARAALEESGQGRQADRLGARWGRLWPKTDFGLAQRLVARYVRVVLVDAAGTPVDGAWPSGHWPTAGAAEQAAFATEGE